MKTLIVATRADTASVNIYQSLLRHPVWSEIYRGEDSIESSGVELREHDPTAAVTELGDIGSSSIVHHSANAAGDEIYLWLQKTPLLRLDFPNRLFEQMIEVRCETTVRIDDILFLSKHKAASGKKSLTVHPIGIPWLADAESYGGKPGRCSPPSPRIGKLYCSLLSSVRKTSLAEKYEVTMEATHHGPFSELPCCFVEIGSTDSDWLEEDAGSVWSEVLIDHFSLRDLASASAKASSVFDSVLEGASQQSFPSLTPDQISEEKSESSSSSSYVIVSIGGGHYVPRMNDIARLSEKFFIGHALATYTLEKYLSGEELNQVPGGWKAIINEAISSTQMAHPSDRELICLLDKKAFKAGPRSEIIAFLEGLQVKWFYGVSDLKTLL